MGLWSAEYLFGKNSKKTENRASVIEMIAPVKKSRGFGGMPENFKKGCELWAVSHFKQT
jgi:hypothetical protein